MKTVKKVLSLLLAVMLLAMMALPVCADSLTITITNEAPNHVYEAYQVFTGSLSESGVLSDVEWGPGVDGTALLAALKASDLFLKDGVNQFAACTDAASVAKVLGSWSYNEAPIKNFADVVSENLTDVCFTSGAQENDAYVITVDTVGYYFIKDAQALTGYDGATDYLLQVVKSTEVAPKVSGPTFAKTVNSALDGTYSEAIDAQIGDTVYFKLESKLPSLYNDYKQYHMHITDELPEGLHAVKVESVYIQHASNATTVLNDTQYEADVTDHEVSVDLGDLKSKLNLNLNDTIVVKFSATVTTDAVMGQGAEGLGNMNNATLSASNNMNQPADTPADEIEHGTLSDSASVYVYQLEVTKVDSLTKAPLKGAEFYLFRNVTNADSTVTKLYAHTDADGVITAWDEAVPANKLVSGDDGTFVIKGLDGIAYHLEEVKAPDGYNKMDDAVLVTMAATISGQELTALSCTADGTRSVGTVEDGLVAVSINNTSGATLPATGGMGTTIFYVAGTALLLAAAVLLIVKKRKEA